mmetsp:Transcript_57750/g.148562  ORF Transcript_57750/g.148562 Transcript_57750/m.148562 type:complete len:208 (+) Transcript_57750:456-1079(+)
MERERRLEQLAPRAVDVQIEALVLEELVDCRLPHSSLLSLQQHSRHLLTTALLSWHLSGDARRDQCDVVMLREANTPAVLLGQLLGGKLFAVLPHEARGIILRGSFVGALRRSRSGGREGIDRQLLYGVHGRLLPAILVRRVVASLYYPPVLVDQPVGLLLRVRAEVSALDGHGNGIHGTKDHSLTVYRAAPLPRGVWPQAPRLYSG